jgi:uncharacterized protein YbcI
MVALHREHFGRGPAAAKSFTLDSMLLCVLSDVYTVVEKTLIRAGQSDSVRDSRQRHQIASREQYTQLVEELTRRKVAGFVSTVGFDPDVAVELFMLEPLPSGKAPADEGGAGS